MQQDTHLRVKRRAHIHRRPTRTSIFTTNMPVLNNMVAAITRKHDQHLYIHNLTPTPRPQVIGRIRTHLRIFSMVSNIIKAKIHDQTTTLETLRTTINNKALLRVDQNGIKPHLGQHTIFGNR